MEITERLLPINPFSRPGQWRLDTLAIVYHWTGAAGQENDVTARYFELLAFQDVHDGKPYRYASAHAIVGMDGEILQVLPWDEVAYHVGAREYTGLAQHRFRGFTSNRHRSTPNWCIIGIELCHPDESGIFTGRTIAAAEWLGWWLLRKYTLGKNDIFRHYDITGKICPKYFVDHPEEFRRLRERVDAINLIEV